MKIAFFDSGIGGLTVFYEAVRLFPNHNYLYFADSKNAPYGSQPESKVRQLILEAINFLAQKDIDALVLACHTASRLMVKELRSQYDFPIIRMQSGIPKEALEENKKVLICGTNLSIKTWEKSLKFSPIKATYLSLQELIIFAERFEINSPNSFDYLYSKLRNRNWENYHSIILGCTHFPFFKQQIQKVIPKHIQILDGGLKTVQQLNTIYPFSTASKKNTIEYFISKKPKAAVFFEKYLALMSSSHAVIC